MRYQSFHMLPTNEPEPSFTLVASVHAAKECEMQNASDVQTGRLLQFLVTAGVVAGQTRFNGWDAFVVAAVLWLIAWLAARLAASAVSRLGGTAWSLLAQLGALFGLFLWLVPGSFPQKVLM